LGYSIIQTSDHGYAIAGTTTSYDGDVSGYHPNTDTLGYYPDVWVVKLNAGGVLQWQKCLGGNGDDEGYSIIQSTGGGYAIGATADSNNGDVFGIHGGRDIWVVKLEPLSGVTNSGSNFSLTNFFSMYPNPASETIHVQLFEATSELRQIQFYDMLGVQHFPDYHLDSKNGIIDVHSLPTGIYLARNTWFRNGGLVTDNVPIVVQH